MIKITLVLLYLNAGMVTRDVPDAKTCFAMAEAAVAIRDMPGAKYRGQLIYAGCLVETVGEQK